MPSSRRHIGNAEDEGIHSRRGVACIWLDPAAARERTLHILATIRVKMNLGDEVAVGIFASPWCTGGAMGIMEKAIRHLHARNRK